VDTRCEETVRSQRTTQEHLRRGNTWKRDLEKEMWMAGFITAVERWNQQHQTELDGDMSSSTRQSWMETCAAAPDGAGWRHEQQHQTELDGDMSSSTRQSWMET